MDLWHEIHRAFDKSHSKITRKFICLFFYREQHRAETSTCHCLCSVSRLAIPLFIYARLLLFKSNVMMMIIINGNNVYIRRNDIGIGMEFCRLFLYFHLECRWLCVVRILRIFRRFVCNIDWSTCERKRTEYLPTVFLQKINKQTSNDKQKHLASHHKRAFLQISEESQQESDASDIVFDKNSISNWELCSWDPIYSAAAHPPAPTKVRVWRYTFQPSTFLPVVSFKHSTHKIVVPLTN